MKKLRLGGVALCLALATTWITAPPGAHPSSAAPPALQLRRPVAAAYLPDGRTLCVANQRSGSVSLVDVARGEVRDEWTVGEQLADLAVLPDGKHVLVIDSKRHELIALNLDGGKLTTAARLEVGPYPISVAVQPDGRRATIACQWSHKLAVVDLSSLSSPHGASRLRVVHEVRLPFAPRTQCALPPRGLVAVAAAFGGRLALVDASSGRLVATHTLTGHNLRGLALSADGKQLLATHQVLEAQAAATRANIERGVLMANVVRSIPVESLASAPADLDKISTLVPLGSLGKGAGDPAGIVADDAGSIAVALAGVNEIALLQPNGEGVRRIAVGRRPTALVKGGRFRPLVVLNTLDDSLSFVDPRRGIVTRTLSLGPQPALGPQERGELLFYDARLSRHGWLSCHSCHSDGHTSGQRADTQGDNTYGTPKRTLTLMNTAFTDPWAWNGETKYLHDQVQKSLEDTMHAPSATAATVNDLVTFLHTLPPPPPLEPATADPADRKQWDRGRRIFHEHRCVRCHIPPMSYSSPGTHDVGFSDERGLRKFNAPSLRGVSQNERFLHDGRAATLEEVFSKFGHKVDRNMPAADRADLLRFLRSL